MIPPGANAFVLFQGTDRTAWWDVFTRPGYRHVAAFWFDGASGRWVVLEYQSARLVVMVLEPEAFDSWLLDRQVNHGARVLRVRAREWSSKWGRLGLWCVPVTAHLVGSRSRAFTPAGLWRDLVREGAVPAFDGRQEPVSAHDESPEAPAGGPGCESRPRARRAPG